VIIQPYAEDRVSTEQRTGWSLTA